MQFKGHRHRIATVAKERYSLALENEVQNAIFPTRWWKRFCNKYVVELFYRLENDRLGSNCSEAFDRSLGDDKYGRDGLLAVVT